jgi:GTP-binding protein
MPKFPPIEFLTSAWQPHQFPPDEGAEVTFAGRSNAGKSSALNVITGRTHLARVSKTPGRTQLVNFFRVDDQRRLSDLPGYGFAKVPADMQRHWRELLSRYVERRVSLAGIVIVMDARRPLTDYDNYMLEWVTAQHLPVHLLLTKADKLNRGESISALRTVLARTGEFATAQLFSALKKTGVDEARSAVLTMLNKQWQPARTADSPVDHALEKKDPGG